MLPSSSSSSSHQRKPESSSSSSSHQRKPDVFVNFRGPDIRNTFISHLFYRLDHKGIDVFKDNDGKDAGKEITDKILEAIHQASFALVVFSKNYAESTWCLNELVEILNCKRKRENPKLVVIPIFHIDTDEVSKWAINGKFEKALKSVNKEAKDGKKKEWKRALEEAKGISGYELKTDGSGNESELIRITVDRLVEEIQLRDANPPQYLVEGFGPFGGKGEKSWDFVDIKGIAVRHTHIIKSITFEVDDTTSFEPQTSDGQHGGENTFKVKLRDGEYITSFSGYFKNENDSGTLISSLTFRTNKRKWGPFGDEEGEYFSLPSEVGRVSQFFGRSGNYLESIGAQVELYYPHNSVGLWGSSTTTNWNDGQGHTNVRKIIVMFEPIKGPFIRSIEFHYEVKNETSWQVKTHGTTAHDVESYPIQIHDPDEYLTSISGYYKDKGITSLTLQTNKKTIGPITSIKFQTKEKTSGPIGDKKGRHFSSPMTGGKIVGFYGWSDEYLEAIGAYIVPISHHCQIKSIGPFGDPGGARWYHGQFEGVREIQIIPDDGIRYIKFVYDNGSEQVPKYKGSCNNLREIELIKLDYPREYLTSISGFTREDDAIIQSLTFYSNRRRLGPYGKETGKYFWYPSTRSKIIGFYGTWDMTLKSIGVYVEPIPHLSPFITVKPFGFGGTPWDDGVYTDVRGFHIGFGNVIHSIGIAYDNNGSFVLGSEHGQQRQDNYERKEVMLDYPKERLLSIKVWVEQDGNTGQTIVQDVQIFTTKKTQTYGPFITIPRSKRDKLETYRIPLKHDGGRIVGFFGRAGTSLNSIGARLEPY